MRVSEVQPRADEKSTTQFCTINFFFLFSVLMGVWFSMYMNTFLAKSKEKAEI